MNYGGGYAQCISDRGCASKRVDDLVCAIHRDGIAETVTNIKPIIPLMIMEYAEGVAHNRRMLSTAELLGLLDERGIKGVAVAECLELSTAGVSRLLNGERQLKLDEAKKLVERFKLVADRPVIEPLTIPVARLLILHAASYLGLRVDPEDPRVEELAQDFRAFSRFALDPSVRDSREAATGFLQGVGQARSPAA